MPADTLSIRTVGTDLVFVVPKIALDAAPHQSELFTQSGGALFRQDRY